MSSHGVGTNRERSSTDVKPGWTFLTGRGRAASQVWSERSDARAAHGTLRTVGLNKVNGDPE